MVSVCQIILSRELLSYSTIWETSRWNNDLIYPKTSILYIFAPVPPGVLKSI